MYLEKHTYVMHYDDKRKEIVGPAGCKYPPGINPDRVQTIVEQVGYWRKANAIHAWFVRECGKGVDECQEIYVPREKLEELLNTVETVLGAIQLEDGEVNNGWEYTKGVKKPIIEKGKVVVNPAVAEELLPTQSGFFFGGTDYDQWYVEDLKATQKIIKEALAEGDGGDFHYRASW